MVNMTTTTATKPPPTMADVRSWAQGRGLQVNAQGNVPNTIVEAFNKGRPPHRRYERGMPSRDQLETR
ncbi:MAG: Lsr2 [Frankiales bacterium]|nr:Lsr2 [Frankiales bacterium]